MPSSTFGDYLIRYGLYPLLLLATGIFAWHSLADTAHLSRHYGYYLGGMICIMVAVETAFPLRREWKMTLASFLRRDLPFMAAGAATIGLVDFIAGTFVIKHSIAHPTLLAQLPMLPAFLLALLAKDLLWYGWHRAAHELGGRIGDRMWRLHVTHHLPGQVYVLMHAVGHPFDLAIARALSMLPLYFLGFAPEVVFLVVVLVSFQGLVSHFNVDIRVGWLNYVLIGTELHRYHHSADRAEAKNFSAVTTAWDHLFGTFFYQPERPPHRLGVEQPADYPSDRAIVALLALPFAKNAAPAATPSQSAAD
jgi:sterol desaturase/sphingolipid hydroxylase (fatty acid hydroxylase superfamily)